MNEGDTGKISSEITRVLFVSADEGLRNGLHFIPVVKETSGEF